MKFIVLSMILSLSLTSLWAQETKENKVGTPENPVAIQKAKHHVSVELTKQTDENGEVKIVTKETRVAIPESFPKYLDTGNPKQDEAVYYEAKQKWIKEHPEEYKKIKHLNL